MCENKIPERVKKFIFEPIDSVELLEILLKFYKNPSHSWTPQTLAAELRSNPNSVSQRILILKSMNLVCETTEGQLFSYNPHHADVHDTIAELEQAYRVQPYRIFELIFSPSKKARDFAEAFRKGKSNKDGRDDD